MELVPQLYARLTQNLKKKLNKYNLLFIFFLIFIIFQFRFPKAF